MKHKRKIAWMLAVALILQVLVAPIGNGKAVYAAGTKSPDTELNTTGVQADTEMEENTKSTDEEKEATETVVVTPEETNKETESEQASYTQVFENETIKIYTLQQLLAIGTDQVLTTTDNEVEGFGTGESVEINGMNITYALDATYELMNEIELDERIWTLPENFTGNFLGAEADEKANLYDAETDTIYIYNNYQLLTLSSENADMEPVMSKDMVPTEFGIGQLLYPEGDNQTYLTYNKEHRYVIAQGFTAEMPELKAEALADGPTWLEGESADGRTTPGQLYEKIDGEKYILIGNESQLRAIGSDKYVTPRLYVYNPPGLLGGILGSDPTYTPYYPGDADLGLEAVAPEGGTTHLELFVKKPDKVNHDKYIYYEKNDTYKLADINLSNNGILDGILNIVGGILGALLTGKSVICGVDENGLPNNEKASIKKLKEEYGNLKYSSNANYIIFRNIDLSADGVNSNKQNDNWKPIHFSGKMEGCLEMMEGNVPTISNITVNQTGKLDLEKDSGIGFFGTIANQTDMNTFKSAGSVVVKNLKLNQVIVDNQSTEIDKTPDSLIEGVTGLLGGLLGGIVDGITSLLPILGDLKLGDVIEQLLTLKQNSPDLFATGSFAGRIVGDVVIENCVVTEASVSSVKGISGGFVGYTEGEAEYELLSGALGGVVKILSTLLNVIPGVGLGDLITILLENDIPLGNLIPIGYYNPKINNSSVSLTNGVIGNADQNYNGGFVGIQTATKMNSCSVAGLTAVQAKTGAGGFAGIARDAVVKGALNDLGVEINSFDIRSEQTNCKVAGNEITVSAAGSYAGGFNGVLANSISQSCSVQSVKEVTVADSYAGGFAGRATIGYGLAVGGTDEKNNTLLNAVSKLLGQLVTDHPEKLNKLLSLSGSSASEIRGCQVTGSSAQISAAQNYAGGITGQGDGVKITADSTGNQTVVNGISSVTSVNYVGGIAGSLSTADAIGVLNNTIGVGQYLPFEISDTKIMGSELSVVASGKYAAGGAGLLLGGSVNQTSVNGLREVKSGNYAGGFAGRAGTSSLAATGGLNILGLVKVNNLLSLADGIRVSISNTQVSGVDTGIVIEADGTAEAADGEAITAGGFVAEAVGIEVSNSSVTQVKEVKAYKPEGKESYAGGFVGRSHTGGLVGLAQENEDGTLKLPGILNVDSLLGLLPYLMPEYTNATVNFVSNAEKPQVDGQFAGGFVGAMQSGTVDNSTGADAYAVYGLECVKGQFHAGGFAGRTDAGATASSDGLKLLDGILTLDIGNLLSVLNVYVPIIRSAGVKSAEKGFAVEATDKDSSAGGFIGSGSGVQITSSDVTSLKHTKVTPPPDSLEAADGSSYFSQNSAYAVKGGKYAGGYIGCVDIDSAAAVGGGLKLLGSNIELTNVLEVLETVGSTIEESDVSGCVGGFSVLANGTDSDANVIGKAGGFAGEMSGAIIRKSYVENFAYIIGQEMAGGYVGLMEPGNVASVLENGDLLNSILGVTDSLANLVQSFIPIIEDSQTSSIPCGGAVRAEGLTDTKVTRGMAGGYVGYNHGGRIDGTNTECAVNRIRSVYGGEFAGGFTGVMENADLAGTGNLELLFGLLETSNVLSLLGAVYPTETNTAVYGPLRNVDMATWNAWAEAVGNNGVYGYQFPTEPVSTQEELNQLIKQYAYGYNVKAGRTEAGSQEKQAGNAGGYVGRMQGGVVTEAHAWDAKNVTAYQNAGGFAGEMITSGVAEIGAVSLLGLPITGAINAVQTFVPVIRNSDITGFQSGMQVKATGISQEADNLKIEKVGHAGGFVGHMIGGQIWGNWQNNSRSAVDAVPDPNNNRCFTANLRRVDGTNSVGGFAGRIDPGSAAALDTAGSSGLLGGLLQNLINTPGDLLSLLNATLSTVRASDVKAWDEWGIVINGVYTNGETVTKYAKAAGGFAGEINGAVIGEKGNAANGVQVENIRSVTGGEYAGGFFGLADVSAVAEISGGGNTSILAGLLKLGSIDVLDAFRTYIYDSNVVGTKDAGLEVSARDRRKMEYDNNPVYTGNAGGFGGALLNGSVKNSTVINLRKVEGQNYTGGFIGHLGKSGVVDLDSLGVLSNVLGLGAGVMDIFGSHVDDSKVVGMEPGFTVKSNSTVHQEEKSEIAGGFTGYADLARLSGNTVDNLKQVASGETAGGFAGKTSFAYLAEIKGDSVLVQTLLGYLNTILKALWVEELQQGQVIKINLGIITVDALYDGNLVHLNLLGLDIRIALAKDKQLATVYIGDSKIELNCASDGSIQNGDTVKNEIVISLIKANRTKIDGCTVTGIDKGYDVYGGGAGNKSNGSGKLGYAGGFVGLNNEGLLKNNQMYLADVVRGTKGIVGPFTGASSLDSSWEFNTVFGIEGENNFYRIYRALDAAYTKIIGNKHQELQNKFDHTADWNIYTIKHMESKKVEQFIDLKDTHMSDGKTQKELLAYMEDGAMAVLMDNTPTTPTEPGDIAPPPDAQDPCTDRVELNIKKIWKNDDEGSRPKEIRLHVTRTYKVGEETIQDTKFEQEIILDASDYTTGNIWEKVLSGPEYTAYHVGEDGTKYYYTYKVTEDALDGYTTTITYTGNFQYGITIINEKKWFDSLLPDTGGMGDTVFYMVAILLLVAFGITELKRRKAKKQSNYK